MTSTYKVRFWEVRKRNRARPYDVRWLTEGREHSESFVTKALANARRSELMQAARRGEAFEIASGLPVSEVRRKSSPTLVELAAEYVAMQWPDQAANSRRSRSEALATACAAFVVDAAGRPEVRELRRVLTVSWSAGVSGLGRATCEVAAGHRRFVMVAAARSRPRVGPNGPCPCCVRT
ncbi:MAG: hypothetical protein ACT4O0_06115 [Pseudonocardia sp.]